MASSPLSPVISESADRRQHPRQRLDQLAYIGFGPDNGGVLLDISAEGLRCQVVGSVVAGAGCHVKFSLPGQRLPLEADGEVIWANGTNQGGGIRFTQMAPETRRHLEDWMREAILGAHVRRSAPIPIRKMAAAPPTLSANAAAHKGGSAPTSARHPVPIGASPRNDRATARIPSAARIAAAKKLAAKHSLQQKPALTLPTMSNGTPGWVKIAILIVCLIAAYLAFASAGLSTSQWVSLIRNAVPPELSSELDHLKDKLAVPSFITSRTTSLSSSTFGVLN